MAVAVVDVRVDSSSAVRNLQQLDAASKRSQSAIAGLSGKVLGLGAALAGGFALQKIIQDVTELDRNIRRLGTVGMDVGKISPALAKLSDELGGVASKAELAAASYQAASAGFADTAGNIQILNAATKAAVGGLADTQAVTEVLVKTLNAYGMSGTRAFEVTDSISKAVELGNQEWGDYTSLLGRVVSTTALAGVSINEMNAFIASATKNGATAEVAFTGLSGVLNTLLQPTKESQTAAAKLGIAWNYGGLQAKGFTGLMAQLAVAMEKDKETTARLLGSQEAMRGAFAANAKGGRDFAMVLEQLSGAAGKTDADFQIMKGSLENTTKALDTSFQNLSEALAKAFGPTIVITIQDLTKSVNGFANVMSSIPQPVMDAVGALIKLGIQMMLVKKAFNTAIALRTAYVAATTAMAASTASTGTAAATSSNAFALYARNTQALAAQSATAVPKVTALGTAIRSLAAIGAVTIAIDVVIRGATEAFSTINQLNQLRQERTQPGGISAVFGGSATEAQKKEQRDIIARLRNQSLMEKGGLTTQGLFTPLQTIFELQNAPLKIALADAQIRKAQSILALPTRSEAAVPTPTPAPTGAGIAPPADKDSKKAADDAARIARQIQQSGQELDLARAIYDIEGRLLDARQKGIQPLVLAREAQKELLRINAEAIGIKTDKDLPAAAKKNQLDLLAVKAANVSRQLAFDILTYEQERTKAAEGAMMQLEDELGIQNAKLHGVEAEYILSLQIRDLKAQYPALNEAEVRSTIAKTDALKKQVSAAEELKQLYSDIGMSIKSGVVDAIQSAIDGTKSLQQVAADLLNSLANKLLDVAVNMALFGAMSGTGTGGGLLGGLFQKRAQGGSVIAGQPYLVGERGPELFMPGRSGGIAPSGSFGGSGVSVVVNVDASGSSVQGDQGQGKQLGMMVSAAVQAELVKQRRPGGLLA